MIETAYRERFDRLGDYIRESRHWHELRDRVLFEREHECECCHATDSLHVHHLTYERLGFELDTDVQVLCSTCHRDAHDRIDELRNVEKARREDKPLYKFHRIPL